MYFGVLHCAALCAVCVNMLNYAVIYCGMGAEGVGSATLCAATVYSVLQCVVMCCSML